MKFSTKYSLPLLLAPFFILLFSESQYASAKFCTKLQSQIRRNTSTIMVTCIQKFQETCSFFNMFSYCTHYRIAKCEKKLNFTYQWYYAVQECCQGYYKVSNHSCMAPKDAAELPVHLQTEETREIAQKHRGPAPVRLSPGAYAGIAAAGVLLLCIIGLVIVVIHRQQKKKKPTEQTIEMEHVSLQPQAAAVVHQNGLNPSESVEAEQRVGLNQTEPEQNSQCV